MKFFTEKITGYSRNHRKRYKPATSHSVFLMGKGGGFDKNLKSGEEFSGGFSSPKAKKFLQEFLQKTCTFKREKQAEEIAFLY